MVTLALVGVGRWGKNYVKTIEQMPGVQLKYLCAKSTHNFRDLPEKYIKLTDHTELEQFSDIDGVIIASPASTHFSIAKDLADKNFPLLIEKPLTTSYRDALALQEIYKKKSSIVMVGYIHLYNPAFVATKALVKKVRKLVYMDMEGMQYGPDRMDISSLWDWSPHDISMVLDLLGKKPIKVAAWGNRHMSHIKLVFSNVLNIYMYNGWVSPVKKRRVTIVGENDAVIFDDTAEKKIAYFHNLNGNKHVSYPDYSSEQPLVMQVKEFVRCIREKRKPMTDLQQGVDVVKILDAADLSIHSHGKEIKLSW